MRTRYTPDVGPPSGPGLCGLAAAAATTGGGAEIGVDGAGDGAGAGASSRSCSLGNCCFFVAAAAAAPATIAPARGPGEDDGRVGAGLGA